MGEYFGNLTRRHRLRIQGQDLVLQLPGQRRFTRQDFLLNLSRPNGVKSAPVVSSATRKSREADQQQKQWALMLWDRFENSLKPRNRRGDEAQPAQFFGRTG